MYSVVLFDLDGTLTDPKIGIIRSIQYALSRLGINESDPDLLVSFIGAPLFECFKKHFSLDEPTARQAMEFYREYFSRKGLYENAVFPEIPELLAYLYDDGRTLAVATLKPTPFAEEILAHFGLIEYFSVVSGCPLDYAGLSKADVIQQALRRAECTSAQDVIMVGDREHDVCGARDNGIHSIAVTYGYGSIQELTGADPTYLADSVKALKSLLV